MTGRLFMTNNSDCSEKELRHILPQTLPYGVKFISIKPSVNELYDYLLIVEFSDKYIKDHLG